MITARVANNCNLVGRKDALTECVFTNHPDEGDNET